MVFLSQFFVVLKRSMVQPFLIFVVSRLRNRVLFHFPHQFQLFAYYDSKSLILIHIKQILS